MGLSPIKEGQEKILKNTFHKVVLVNEAQLFTFTGSPGGGTVKLTAEGQETAIIAYNASAASFQAAIEALSTVGSGNFSASGSAGGPYTGTWIGALAGTPIPLMTLSTNALTGGTSPSMTIARTATGVGTIPQFYYIGLSQQLRATLGEAVALSAIQEVTGTGYSRIRVKTNSSEWVDLFTAGFWQVTSKLVTFSATAGDWTIARSLFICDQQTGSSGKLIDIRDITAVTLGNGQSQSFDLVEAFKDTA